MNLHEVPNIPGTHYIPSEAVEEIKSSNSRQIFELFRSQHNVTILDPDEKYRKKAQVLCSNIGQTGLSKVDLEVLALLFMIQDMEPVTLISDDYAIRNVAHSQGIESGGVKTTGGNQLRLYFFKCNACQSIYKEPIDECEVCGHTSFTRFKRKK